MEVGDLVAEDEEAAASAKEALRLKFLQKMAFANLRLKAKRRKAAAAAAGAAAAAATAATSAPPLPAPAILLDEASLRFELSAAEAAAGRLSDATLAAVASAVERAGVACIELPTTSSTNVLPPDAPLAACSAAAASYFASADGVGRRRAPGRWDVVDAALMEVAPFDSRALRWSGFWAKLVRRLLGPACRLDRTGVVFAQEGAAEQGVHRDGKHLFYQTGNTPCHLPPHCLHVFVPLIDIATREGGPTQFWPGTHRHGAAPRGAEDNGVTFTETRALRAGSAVIFDFRILHRGLANASDALRPMLYFTFARAWFRDDTNYGGEDARGHDKIADG